MSKDNELIFRMTTGESIPFGGADEDIEVKLDGDLFYKYVPDTVTLQSSGESVLGHTGKVVSKDGTFTVYFEYGPNVSNNGYIDFYNVVSPFTAEAFVKDMLRNGPEGDYAEIESKTVDGRTIAVQYGRFTDYAENCSEVLQYNVCMDMGNGSHLSMRVYNRLPLDEYNEGREFVMDSGIVDVLLKNIVTVNNASQCIA